MAGLKSFLIGLLLVGLFSSLLITAGIQLAQRNNSPNTIANDPTISDFADNLNENLTSLPTITSSAEDSIGSSPVTLDTGAGIILNSVGGLWKTLKTIPTSVYDLTVGLLVAKIFSGSNFTPAVAIIAGIATIAFIFFVYNWVHNADKE